MKKTKETIFFYIDSEWGKNDEFLCFQLVTKIAEKKTQYFFYHSKYESIFVNFHSMYPSYKMIAWNPTGEQTIMEYVCQDLQLTKKTIYLFFYYAIRDLYHFFTMDFILNNLRMNFLLHSNGKSYLVRKRAYLGNLYVCNENKFVLKDLFGWAPKGGLAGLMDSVGISNEYKKLEGKEDMEWVIQHHPGEFLKYSLKDSEVLEEIVSKKILYLNQILTDLYGFPKELLFNELNIPITTGSLVAKIVKNYILNLFNKENSLPEFLRINELVGKTLDYDFKKKKKTKKLNKMKHSNLLNGGSIKSIAILNQFHTGVLNILVSGGRCINERPETYHLSNIFDLDISGCYGNALKEFVYPLGLPTIYATSEVDCEKITLREFFHEYEKELVPNLYTITISGNFPFEQNLIYSKIVNYVNFQKRIQKVVNQNLFSEDAEEESEDFSESSVDFCILTKEIENGILTSDTIELLRKICTDNEWSAFLKLNVVTAIYYPKSLQCTTIPEWFEKIEKDAMNFQYNLKESSILDRRSRHWYAMPLKNLVEPIIQKRKQIKIEFKQTNEQTKKDELNAIQSSLKLIINTIYGVFSSSYFSIGNTVVANNITSRARTYIWCISRAVYGIQTITDGCAYQPEKVFSIKYNKYRLPGLETLSNYEKMKKHTNVKMDSLENKKWGEIFQNKNLMEKEIPTLDAMITNHIQSFWNHYTITIPYELEHKMENISSEIFYVKKAHYCLKELFTNETKMRIRGHHPLEPFDSVYSLLANNELGFPKKEITKLTHEEVTLAGPADYFTSKKKVLKGLSDTVIIPGFEKRETKVFQYTICDHLCVNKKMYLFLNKEKKDFSSLLLTKDFHTMFETAYFYYIEIYKKYQMK